MTSLLRFSALRVALGYIALGAVALALLAVPLWYAWRANLSTFKAYVHGPDQQRLVEVFHREGANGLIAAIASQAASRPADEIMILADPSKRRLAGNLSAWPAQIPDEPGTYGLEIDVGGGATKRMVGSQVVLPGGYRLLLARESVLHQRVFIERFWLGIAGATLMVLLLGAAFGWLIRRGLLAEVQGISRTASAIASGDLSHRLATRGRSPELDALAETVNGMLTRLATQNAQLEGEVAVRRQAEQALHRAHDELEDMVAHRTAELARANESLQLSEERYARALEASDAGYWDWSVCTGEMFQSARMMEMLGFPPDARFADRDDFMGRIPFHPDDRERVTGATAAALDGGADRYEVDYRIVLPTGETRWVRARGKVYRDHTGCAMRVAGSLADITDRKAAEDEVRRRRDELQRLMSSISDYVWSAEVAADRSFSYRYYSPVVERITGWPREYLLESRERWLSLLHPLDREWVDDDFQRLISGAVDHVDAEYRIVRPDGTLCWVRDSAHGARVEDGRILLYGVVSDITERKLAEAELRSRQDMLDLAQKVARAVAFEWRIGAGEGENRWSPDLEVMYGLAPGSYDGTFETWKKLVHPDDWPAVKAAIKRAHESGDVAAEYRVVHPDGSVHWLQAKGRMFFDPEGKPTRLVGFMLDVTDRHQAEEGLRRLERQLRQAQRLEAMGTLAGGIAHDFNNILGAILGYGEMALRAAAKDSRLRRDLDGIMTAAERGRALVERILAFSRSGAGERVPVHVEKVVGEGLNLLAAQLPAGVNVERRLRAGRAAVLGDPTQVHQVLMNLVTNAIQAMPTGGTLRVSLDAVRFDARRMVTIGAIADGEYVVLEVADSGSGIPPENLGRIFEPFFTTKDVGVGTGLGLSLVHGMVMDLGGAIDVASTVGGGTTFTVYLPRAGDAAEVGEGEAPQMPHGNRERVLVVDDEEALVRIATETLEELGYRPVGFTSSSAALEAFRADPSAFDVLVTDERMPSMSGSTLIREVRRIRAGIPTMLMSGFIGGTVSRGAREAGADEVLQKPLSAQELAAGLARVLHRARTSVD